MILLTGASDKSFIGRHLFKYLGDLDYKVDRIDKDAFMYTDRRKNKLDKVKPDIVIHCAWIREKDLHSSEHLDFAVKTCKFFKECKNRGIRVINLGSSSEYGVKYEPMKEDMICEPINTYGIAKLMVTLYAKKLGFNTLRLFTVVGEGGHSFADIHKKSKKWSDPFQKRDYVKMVTICLAIQRLIYANHLYGEIINVGSGKETSNFLLADARGKVEEKISSKWFKHKQNQYEPRHWIANTSKIKKLLNL